MSWLTQCSLQTKQAQCASGVPAACHTSFRLDSDSQGNNESYGSDLPGVIQLDWFAAEADGGAIILKGNVREDRTLDVLGGEGFIQPLPILAEGDFDCSKADLISI